MPISPRCTVDPRAKRKVLGASPLRVYPMCETVGASARSVFAFLDNRVRRRRTLIERNCAPSAATLTAASARRHVENCKDVCVSRGHYLQE